MREVAVTRAFRLVEGAQIYGGPYDGLVVDAALVDMPVDGIAPPGVRPLIVLVLSDGSEVRLDYAAEVAWLHPHGKVTRA